MKVVAAVFCVVMLAVVGYLAIFVMPEEGRHRAVNAQWAKDRDVAFSAATGRMKASGAMLEQIQEAFPDEFDQQRKLLTDAQENPSLVIRERVQIDVVRNIVRSQSMYMMQADAGSLRNVVKARRDMLKAMLAGGAIAQCASMYTGETSPQMPNDEALLDADARELQARLTAEMKGMSARMQYGAYRRDDDQALRQAILSIPTDIPEPVAAFKGRPAVEVCRLAILHDDARLQLPNGGTFERAAAWSLVQG